MAQRFGPALPLDSFLLVVAPGGRERLLAPLKAQPCNAAAVAHGQGNGDTLQCWGSTDCCTVSEDCPVSETGWLLRAVLVLGMASVAFRLVRQLEFPAEVVQRGLSQSAVAIGPNTVVVECSSGGSDRHTERRRCVYPEARLAADWHYSGDRPGLRDSDLDPRKRSSPGHLRRGGCLCPGDVVAAVVRWYRTMC